MALTFDPQELPIAAIDDHLPPVSADELRADALRRRFGLPPLWSPEIAVERQFSDRAPTHASVLVPLTQRDEGLSVLLTQRTDHLTDHPGQVSFPGGRAEPEDADAVATALREAREEIGLDPALVDVIGQLPTYTTGSGFIVTPVVGVIQPGFSLTLDPFEVAEAFEVPLAFLMNPAHHRWHTVDVGGVRREFLSMPWTGVDASGQPRRYFVWGATAAMLRNLYRFLAA
ncbi:MAG: CoA pyrophosphatase [Rhizobacter sp.]|nr:CoA pyrophosphatase [Rhizobacter sp.]